MSHHAVANLWGELWDRRDLTFIVRECLGSLWPIMARKPKDLARDGVLGIVLLKQLFDVQRTELRENPHRLGVILPDALLDSLDCITRIAETIARSQDEFMQEILRAALISGFRVALLALEQNPDEDTWRSRLPRLQECVEQWPKYGDIDKMWTLPLLRFSLSDDFEKIPKQEDRSDVSRKASMKESFLTHSSLS